MKYLFLIIASVTFLLLHKFSSQQTLSKVKNTTTFYYQNNQFTEKGWEKVLAQTKGGDDIGNLVSAITDANFDSSLHIMIIGESGIQGASFESKDTQKVNMLSDELKHFSHFFKYVEGDKWHLFKVSQVLKEVKINKIKIEDNVLLNALIGFDYLLVMPEVSVTKFID